MEHFDVIVVDAGLSGTVTYKGFAYSGISNLASSFGYVNASTTG